MHFDGHEGNVRMCAYVRVCTSGCADWLYTLWWSKVEWLMVHYNILNWPSQFSLKSVTSFTCRMPQDKSVSDTVLYKQSWLRILCLCTWTQKKMAAGWKGRKSQEREKEKNIWNWHRGNESSVCACVKTWAGETKSHRVNDSDSSHTECNLSRSALGLLLIFGSRHSAGFFIRKHYLRQEEMRGTLRRRQGENPK